MPVAGRQHVPIARFERREMALTPAEVLNPARTGRAGEKVMQAEEKLLLLQIGYERQEVIAAALNFSVLALVYVIYPSVNGGAARQAAGHFLAREKVGVAAEGLSSVDRVVVRNRDQVHAPALEAPIDVLRPAVAFPAKAAKGRRQTHSRVP